QRILKGHQGPIRSIAFATEQYIVSGGDDRTVRLWDVGTGKQVSMHTKHGGTVQSISVTTDGKRIASAGEDGRICLWDPTADIVQILAEGQQDVRALAFMPHKSWLASGTGDGTLRVWNVDTGACRLEIPNADTAIRAICFSPDGLLLASGGDDNLVKLWDLQARQPVSNLSGHTCNIASIEFSADGTRLISASS